MKHTTLPTIALLTMTACGGVCGTVEDSLDACGATYYGDDNCELLMEGCDDDDETIVEAAFQCIAANCGDWSACDVHFYRLSYSCQRSWGG